SGEQGSEAVGSRRMRCAVTGGGLSGIWGSATASSPWPSAEPEGHWLVPGRTPERHDAGIRRLAQRYERTGNVDANGPRGPAPGMTSAAFTKNSWEHRGRLGGRDRGTGGDFRRAFWAMWSRPPRKGPFWLDGVSEPP